MRWGLRDWEQQRVKDVASHLALQDGRRLGWRTLGDIRAAPIFYCHGWPGTSLEIGYAEEQAREAGAVLIAVDRPGMGESDFQRGRTLLSWPLDVQAIADHLGEMLAWLTLDG